MTQMAMARSLKVSLVTIQFWETGLSMPSPDNMTKLHQLTGITRKQLEQARE
jgi:DNA-binding transcriptional regulator YiaG